MGTFICRVFSILSRGAIALPDTNSPLLGEYNRSENVEVFAQPICDQGSNPVNSTFVRSRATSLLEIDETCV